MKPTEKFRGHNVSLQNIFNNNRKSRVRTFESYELFQNEKLNSFSIIFHDGNYIVDYVCNLWNLSLMLDVVQKISALLRDRT